jgi:hypothetical protein
VKQGKNLHQMIIQALLWPCYLISGLLTDFLFHLKHDPLLLKSCRKLQNNGVPLTQHNNKKIGQSISWSAICWIRNGQSISWKADPLWGVAMLIGSTRSRWRVDQHGI